MLPNKGFRQQQLFVSPHLINVVMQKKQIFVGIDVSKFTLDVAIYQSRDHIKIQNNAEGLKCLKAFLKSSGVSLEDCWMVMEYTGGYEYRLVQFCIAKGVCFSRVPGLEIKRSLGMQRGKNDKVDSLRIATYGYEKQEKLKPQAVCNAAIERLKHLLRQRANFVKERKAHEQQQKELMFMLDLTATDALIKRYARSAEFAHKMMEKTEEEIKALIKTQASMQRNFELLTSIPGVGPVNAWMAITYTGNFEYFTNGRKFGSYCGIVPFENSSGLNKGKSHTSQLANKEVKANLHMAARASVQHDSEMNAFYKRKEAIGKKHLSIMNEVMFKLVLRMFSVVKKQEKFVKKQTLAA